MSEQLQIQRVVSAELGEMLDVSRIAAESYSDIAKRVGDMTDEELIETIVYVSQVEKRAGWLRGLCGLEIQTRIDDRAEASRLAGTHTNLQAERGKAMRQIAAQTGVSERTLRNDVAVVRVLAPIVAERMTGAEVGSVAVMLPDGIDWSVAELISKERDPDRAYDVALDILHDKSTVQIQQFCQSLADRKREEGTDIEPALAESSGTPAVVRPVVTRTEFISASIAYESKAKLIKLQEKENLPTLGLAIERAIDIAWDGDGRGVSKRRSDARNAVK
ncbi:MAG: hypothetical protein MSG64_06480 [Pyrinomonadaceae bacterium MAG19_C2-C3]|nr:hypothetical protein [Pyrinomonadaceae bacterium MAG19_C2-C3]